MSDVLNTMLVLVKSKNYLAIAVIVIGYCVRLTAPDSKFPITIPDRWKPVVVLGLGQVYGTLVAISHGIPAKMAIYHGVMTALVTMGLFDVVMKAIFNGNEPAWVKKLALVFDELKKEEPVPLVEADKATLQKDVEEALKDGKKDQP